MRKATSVDGPQLVKLMQAFYTEAGYPLSETQATAAFAPLLADKRQGAVWLLEAARETVGYLVLTRYYSMEYGGPKAVLDDFFAVESHRNAGVGTAALADLPALCRARGLRAVTVEVGSGNAPAQRVYRRAGFAPAPDRQLLAWALAAPTHEL